ncbi:MAG: hypothetical protein F6K36_17535 [Symploca sp. SIO3C6]|uniref:Uncharacterized protein n=1 Tax=Symploca sp. SIO1C4 TaxID=2607765 RepID=A0A6B3NG71_9CYAN|nr:hypothetical protein [Symploca sp. SIO3C6]NER29542.1 hypothetical protein [Symploca sp. SIO1C4]NET07231.1 hypothetical protein [Symploca sp. SIO2B6]
MLASGGLINQALAEPAISNNSEAQDFEPEKVDDVAFKNSTEVEAEQVSPAIASPEVIIKPELASSAFGFSELTKFENSLKVDDSSIPQETIDSQQTQKLTAKGELIADRTQEVEKLQDELRELEEVDAGKFQASPSLSIVIPTGFGADRGTGFVSATYQEQTRFSNKDDGSLGIGVGLGDARQAVGVELSYTIASFGSNRDFGTGGFNLKVHRQLGNDWAVAAGWNGFIDVGDDNDFEDSVYGVVSKVVRTRDDLNLPFSRVAFSAGLGSGQFQTADDVADDEDNINVFGNVAVRVARPVSVIAEWSGQDLGVGVSIAPFKNFPLVITPAVRDLTGAGDEARFVIGSGFAWKF